MTATATGQLLAEMLDGYGVTHVFMVPAIFHSGMVAMEHTKIVRVTTHHEVAAAYMADGYARASGKAGVVMGQSVGAANVAAGLRDAFLSSSAVVAITGGPQPDFRYKYLYQVIDDFPMFEPVTKFNAMVEKPSRLADLLRQAFRAATSGAPGPVHLEFPGRLGEGVAGEGEFEVIVEKQFSRYPAYRPEPEASAVEEAAALLASAERPVIIAGGGVRSSGAGAELVRLAETLSIPVVSSLTGKGTIPENHPLAIGVLGTYGRACAARMVSEADLVFFAGSRAGGLTTTNWNVPRPGVAAIQLDIDPVEIGRNYPVKVGLAGDAKLTLWRLLEASKPVQRPAWVARARESLRKWKAELAPNMASDAVPMRPERVCAELTAALPENAMLVADTGHSAIWTGTITELHHPGQSYIRCAGTLGWAFPGAIGAKCAVPDRPVVCFTGDGGIMYHLAELETAARLGINLVTLVNNNRSLQQVKRGLDAAYGGKQWGRAHEVWVFRDGTNFARIAEEFGCLGIRVESPNQVRPALDRALAAGRPALIDVVTDIEAVPAWG